MMVEKLEKLLIKHPDLRPFLLKICVRCRKKGILTGVMKLGQSLGEGELDALHAVFGLQALSISRSDEVRISFDKFFKEMAPAAIDEWIDGLHYCLNLARRDEVYEMGLNQQRIELILEQLRIAYPELNAVHLGLKADSGITRRLLTSGQDIQKIYFKVAEITRFLRENSDIITFSDLGARFCNDSKALRNTDLSRLVESWLLIMDNGNELALDAEQTVWARHHVVRDRLSVQATIFGPLIYEKNNRLHDWIYKLWQAGEPATLSWANIDGIDRIYVAEEERSKEGTELITCENETPFCRMIRDRQPEILLYTSGFPNDAVMLLYKLIAPQAGSCRHWGDSDLAGLQIAAMLHAVHPLELWRCDAADLAKHLECLIDLTKEQKQRLERFLTKQPDFYFARELRFTLEHGWLEQESWLFNSR